MNPQHPTGPEAKRKPEDQQQKSGKERTHPEKHPTEAHTKAEQAARSVMHPESYDPEWRYYHGAWGG
ncbi:MAG: hypothetical protein ACM30E_04020 [Nitrososphaerales archaeon]